MWLLQNKILINHQNSKFFNFLKEKINVSQKMIWNILSRFLFMLKSLKYIMFKLKKHEEIQMNWAKYIKENAGTQIINNFNIINIFDEYNYYLK